jgi:purine-binding chemotaxis protein CheW
VCEVVELGAMTPVPGSTPVLLGVCNLKGEILPCVDLCIVMGVAGDASRELLVVVADDDRRAGLAVDEVVDVGPAPDVVAIDVPALLGRVAGSVAAQVA